MQDYHDVGGRGQPGSSSEFMTACQWPSPPGHFRAEVPGSRQSEAALTEAEERLISQANALGAPNSQAGKAARAG
jgi:hypothetical protein